MCEDRKVTHSYNTRHVMQARNAREILSVYEERAATHQNDR